MVTVIAWAPITWLVDWFTTSPVWREMRLPRGSTTGEWALDAAEAEIGNGEEGQNNAGPHIERYRGGVGGKGAWCAAFIYYCILTAVAARGGLPPFERTHGARKLFRRAVRAGMRVKLNDIQPGDIALWARASEGSWQAHIGIVSRVWWDTNGVSEFSYIAGNEGPYPARVEEHRGTRKRRLIGFARLP